MTEERFICPDDHQHGVGENCYRWHGCRCDVCSDAMVDRFRKKRRARGVLPAQVPALGARRRIQALISIGWTYQNLEDESGYGRSRLSEWARGKIPFVRGRTAVDIAVMYDRLCMMPPPRPIADAQRRAITKAVRRAARNGWVPPLAWEDIDHDEEPPYPPMSYRLAKIKRMDEHGEPTEAVGREMLAALRDAGLVDTHGRVAFLERSLGWSRPKVLHRLQRAAGLSSE